MKTKQLVIGILAFIGSVYFLAREVSFRAVAEAVLEADLLYVLIAAAVYFLSVYLRCYRWKLLCRDVKQIPTSHFLGPLYISGMVNFLPIKSSTVVRPFLLGRKENLGFASCMGPIVMERLIDLLFLAAVLALSMIFYPALTTDPSIAGYVRSCGISVLVALAVLSVLCFVLVRHREGTQRSVAYLSRRFPAVEERISRFLGHLADSLAMLKNPARLVPPFAVSFGVILLLMLTIYALYFAFHLQWLPLDSVLMLLVTIYVLSLVVPSPANFGPAQLGSVLVLANIYAVDKTAAASLSMVLWFVTACTILAGGVFFVFRDNVSLSRVIRDRSRPKSLRQVEPAGPPALTGSPEDPRAS